MRYTEPSIDCLYEGGNVRLINMLQNRIIEVRNQTLYGSEPNLDRNYKRGNLRPVAMPLGRNPTVFTPTRNNNDDLPWDTNFENIWGEVNNHNLYDYQSPRNSLPRDINFENIQGEVNDQN